MRIISGKYKGHNLVSFQGEHIRPTTDRVKESLFNILMNDIPEARVLDLFAGTGNLGLEALSRGCREVIFVEKHPKSLQVIRENIQKLKVTETHKIIAKDVMSFLKSYSGEIFDIVFADPPFTETMGHDVVKALDASAVMGPHSILAIESARRERMDDDYAQLYRFDQREFGDKILSLYKKKEAL